jgi:hypothetical protein
MITDFPPPRPVSATADLNVMPCASRFASVNASWSERYDHIRIPPSAGPSVVSCTEMIALRPLEGSSQRTTFS